MATNAFLHWTLGPNSTATLLGISEMPKPGACQHALQFPYSVSHCRPGFQIRIAINDLHLITTAITNLQVLLDSMCMLPE